MFTKIVNAVEALALAAAIAVVILLFAYRPNPVHTAYQTVNGSTASGRAIFTANCATCHGDRGQGLIGPKLGGGQVVARFPIESDEIAIVTNGEGGMPAWAGRLTPAQIKAVVDLTRTSL